MFEDLLNLVTQHAGDSVVNNNQIPNDQNNAVINTSTQSIIDSLKNHISSGNLQQVMSLFNSQGSLQNNQVVTTVTQNVTTDLMTKHGLSQEVANNVVSSLIPTVMNQLVQKTNNPADSSFNIQSIMSTLGGNSGGSSIENMLGGFFK